MEKFVDYFDNVSQETAPPQKVIDENYKKTSNVVKFACERHTNPGQRLQDGWYWTSLKQRINRFGVPTHYYLIYLENSINEIYIIVLFKDD